MPKSNQVRMTSHSDYYFRHVSSDHWNATGRVYEIQMYFNIIEHKVKRKRKPSFVFAKFRSLEKKKKKKKILTQFGIFFSKFQ